ncbi:hypothetical protein AXG93_4242s1030 [Marchantia polymorpha subsp. ruderalis]|uniref:Uncharacterized protein n=1 Tax=Marchantia polymorpha subsp. ruderalis TaxID=1480154 RepID=A0A176VWV7_MARPO|nr:hypothetical protein AXG93_4242s1030 [Marchantia polymorpha subsp. ruderalis]
MAALGEKGSVLANPQRDKTPSTLIYRPFASWASNSEWSMRFTPAEEVKAVAVGDGWVAAATSLDYLRIYTESGRQKHLFSLTGPVVAMTSYQQHLAVVTHASDPMESGQQVMKYIVLDLRTNQQLLTGPLAITPGATLTWLGFSESGSLSSFDSKVHPKPVLSILSPMLPLAHSDLGATELENDLLCKSFLLEEINFSIAVMNKVSSLTPPTGDKLARALELASMLSLHKSLEGAIKLVTAMRLPTLAERMNTLLEERRKVEKAAAGPPPTREPVFPRSSLLRLDGPLSGPQVHKLSSPALPAKQTLPTTEPFLENSRTVPEASVRSSDDSSAQKVVSVHTKAKEVERSNSQQTPGASDDGRCPEVPSSSPLAKPVNPFAKPKQAEGSSLGDGLSTLTAIKNLQVQGGGKRKNTAVKEKRSDKKPRKIPKAT